MIGGIIPNKLKTRLILISAPFLAAAFYIVCNWRFYFFDDEFVTLDLCRVSWSGFLKALIITEDVHPPLSYILLKIWFSVFKTNIHSSQALSLLLIMLGLFIYCYVFIKIFPRINWLFLFVAIHPLIILWAGSARYYPLLFLLFNLGTLVFLKVFKDKDYGIRTLSLFSLTAIIGLYTEFMYFLALIPQALLIFYSISKFDQNKRTPYLIRFTFCLVVIILAYLPWLPRTSFLIFDNLQRFAKPSVVLNFAYIIYGSVIGQSIMPYDLTVVIPAFIAFGFLFISGMIKMFKRERENFYLWSGLFFGALILALPIRLITVRHFLFFPGLLLIPVFYSVSSFRNKLLRLLFVAIILSIYLYGNLNIFLKRDLHKGGLADPIQEVSRKVSELVSEDLDSKVVLINNSFNNYLKEESGLSGRIEHFFPSDSQVAIKILDLFERRTPSRIIYLWCYYGAQPDFANTDRMLQALLDINYTLVSEYRFNKDARLSKMAGFIDKSYQNPGGYRIIVQEYRIKKQ